MSQATKSTTTPRRPTKSDGTLDRRFGPRDAHPARNLMPFTLADYAISQQHVADFEDRGFFCTLEQDHLGRPEIWQIVTRSRCVRHLLWRAGGRVMTETDWGGGCVITRGFRSIDKAWRLVRAHTSTPQATYSAEATQADAVLATLPAWLTADAA